LKTALIGLTVGLYHETHPPNNRSHLATGHDRLSADPIHDAAWDGDLVGVQAELDKGVDVNAKSDGRTPLHWAAYSGHKEIAELLIGEGAEVNTIDKYTGNTALDSAILLKHTEIADLLRKHGGKTREELKAEGN